MTLYAKLIAGGVLLAALIGCVWWIYDKGYDDHKNEVVKNTLDNTVKAIEDNNALEGRARSATDEQLLNELRRLRNR
jgi:hypothetical protein